jgi:riboflavin synthase
VFAGIVIGRFEVLSVEARADSTRVVLSLDQAVSGLNLGASVAVNGVCLTAVSIDGPRVGFDVVRETLDCTTLSSLRVGQRVNIERSLRVGDEIGGHPVSGHVIGTARVRQVSAEGDRYRVALSLPETWLKYVFHKGFIAVDGCSLTVGELDASGITLNLIPETLRRTTLGDLKAGALVNIELDSTTVAIVDSVERALQRRDQNNG